MYNKHQAACGMSKNRLGNPYTDKRPKAGLWIREASHTPCGVLATIARFLALFLSLLLLAACSSGGGGNNPIFGNESADPATVDFAIFYVKRPVPTNVAADQDDLRRLRPFRIGADLYMRDRASPSAPERNITGTLTNCDDRDIKDVDVSFDGSRVIFAMRCVTDANQDDEDPPTWNIWEYIIASNDLHRVIVSDVIAEEGQDVSPHYLPDSPTDRILFASTRQHESKAIQVFEGGSQFEAQDENRQESAFVLHVMDGVTVSGGTRVHNDSSIHQVTFNQSHDLDPSVLANGRILWSRWDNAAGRSGGNDGIHLYTANPDGSDVQLLYGGQSHQTGTPDQNNNPSTIQFAKAREMQNGKTLALVRPFTYTGANGTEAVFGGDLYIIDTANFVENNQAATPNGTGGSVAQSKATSNDVRTVAGPSPGGRFNSAVPLWDGTNRILVSWSLCRVLDPNDNTTAVPCTDSRLADPNVQAAPSLYSVWMFDPADNTLKPVVEPTEGIMITDVATAQPRGVPAFRTSKPENNPNLDQTLAGEGVGILDIRSVYDFDGTIGGGTTSIAAVSPGGANYASRPARFLRIEKAVSLPDDDVRDIDNSAFGISNFMRQIVGYVPIEPDGSVRVKIPSDIAFQISVLDVNGRRIGGFARHNAWLQLRPGETLKCNGCHTPAAQQNTPTGQTARSHGRPGLFAQAYAGASNSGVTFSGANATFVSSAVEDTMAQARSAWSCLNEQCRSITPSVDVMYSDVWPAGNDPRTEPNPVPAPRVDFSYRYTGASGLKTRIPTSSPCTAVWSSTCRIVINYLDHIQPLWDVSRPVVDAMGVPVLDPVTNLPLDRQCTGCHNPTIANAAAVPAGQLDLTNSPSVDNGAGVRVTSYQRLLFPHNAQELNATMTALQDICLAFQTDPVTNVTTCVQFQTVSPPLLVFNAASSRFFSRFTSTGTHLTNGIPWLSPGELRLVSEWVDIGAQYYNNPFAAPVN